MGDHRENEIYRPNSNFTFKHTVLICILILSCNIDFILGLIILIYCCQGTPRKIPQSKGAWRFKCFIYNSYVYIINMIKLNFTMVTH